MEVTDSTPPRAAADAQVGPAGAKRGQRYLLLSNMYPSEEQPAYGVFVRNMEMALLDRGVAVDRVVVSGRPHGIPGKLVAYCLYTLSGMRSLLRGHYDLIYVHFISLSAIPLLLTWPLIRVPVVFNAHGSDLLPDSALKNLALKLVSALIRRADMLVVPSDYYAQIAADRFPGVAQFVSPSAGVDRQTFNAPREKSFDRDSVHLGFVSRLDTDKGWDTLLDSLALLPGSIRARIKVSIIGSGSEQDRLEQRITEHGWEAFVHRIGSMPQAALADYYRRFDLFVLPSRRAAESLGLVGLEALACGVPVIASDIGGPAGYIEHGVNGWLCKPGDSAGLCDLIADYVRLPPGEKQAFACRAEQSVDNFDKTVVADRLLRELEKLRSNA